MTILDCESVESTYNSLEQITGLKVEELKSIKIGLKNNRVEFEQNFSFANINEVDYTMWFHMTRVFDKSVFNNGILPIREAYDILTRQIENFIEGLDIKRLPPVPESYIESAHHCGISICNRINNIYLGGPYAVLIKNLGFSTVHGKYLCIPETVESLLVQYSVHCRRDIIPIYKEKTKPCIVKFRDNSFSESYLKDALYYLYCVENDLPLRSLCGFDGNGNTVKNEEIVDITLL